MTFHFSSFYLNYEALNLDPMKKYATLLLLAFSCNLSAQYFPTVEDNPIWNVLYLEDGFSSRQVSIDSCFMTCGDEWCRVVETTDNFSFELGYINEQDSGVYFKKNLDCNSKVSVLYDSSLGLGDSIYLNVAPTFYNPDSLLFKVDSIFFSENPRLERKVIRLNYEYQYHARFIWYSRRYLCFSFCIEGIGNVKHPIYSAVCYEPLPFCGYINLLCGEIAANPFIEKCSFINN